MLITVVRPASTFAAGIWTAFGAATLHAATSDNSDASYAVGTILGNSMVLHAPFSTTAGYQRHRFRPRVRRGSSTPWSLDGAIGGVESNITAGSNTGGEGNPGDVTGSWVLAANDNSPTTVRWSAQLVSPDLGTCRLYELYMDIDERLPPSFTEEVHDGAGVNRDGGVVADTSRPVFVFDSPDYDGLVARNWALFVRTDPGGVLVYEASGSGTPPEVQSDPLVNGDYEAEMWISSYIRNNEAYFSTVETVTFEVAFVAPAGPVLTLTPILSPPSIEIDWVSDTATATTWDVDADVVTEIRRTDCNGTSTIYVERTGITAAEWIDRFMSLSYSGVFCDEEDHDCQVCYEARYWGEVDDVLVATDWSTPVCDDVANPTVGNAWMRGADSGDISICPTETFGHVRPFGVFQPIGGGIPTVVTGTPGGRDYTLDFAVTSEADLVLVESILAQPLFFYQPVEQADIWLAPANQNMTVTKVKRIRTVNVPCVAVNPQPVTDPASLF